MTIREALSLATSKLQKSGIETARLDAELLLSQAVAKERPWQQGRSWLHAHGEDEIREKDAEDFDTLIAKREQHVPVAYLTGRKEFYGLDLEVTPDTLIPRPETESLVEKVIELAPPNSTVIDVGTGSGAIAIAVKSQRSDLAVTACDISQAALKVASRNAKHLGSDIKLEESDLLEQIKGKFDVIAANLPYLSPTLHAINQDATHEPPDALFDGSSDGLDSYRRLIDLCQPHLAPGGYLIFEAEPDQHQVLIDYAKQHRLHPVSSQNFILTLR